MFRFKTEAGQALIEFCIGLFLTVGVLTLSLSILKESWKRFFCQVHTFKNTHALRIGKSVNPRFEFEETPTHWIGKSKCGEVHLPKIR